MTNSNKKQKVILDKNKHVFGLKIYYCLCEEETTGRLECFFPNHKSAETLLLGCVKNIAQQQKEVFKQQKSKYSK